MYTEYGSWFREVISTACTALSHILGRLMQVRPPAAPCAAHTPMKIFAGGRSQQIEIGFPQC
jgi:hypothetical protein